MSENGHDSASRTVWDIAVNDVFPLVVAFYRKEKDRIVLEYEQKIQLLALFKQEKLGPFSPEKDVDTGYFDMVGSDRRKAWINLGNMGQQDARFGIIRLLDAASPETKTTVLELLKQKKEEEESKTSLDNHTRNAEAHKDTQVLHSQQDHTHGSNIRTTEKHEEHPKSVHVNGASPRTVSPQSTSPGPYSSPNTVADKTEVVRNALAPAALWCKPKAAKHFISKVRATSPIGNSDYQIVINPGELISVQVPTSTNASAIFFEFVTEKEDIGFGLSFQRKSESANAEWPVEQLLPITQRDCSEDLVLGSHQYQVQGIYILHFDNSHSPNTSKVVYYKVFYQTPTH